MLPSRGLTNALRTTGNRPAPMSRTVRHFSNRTHGPLAGPPRLQSRAWQEQRRNLSWFGGSGASQAPPGVNVHRDGATALSTPAAPIKAPEPLSAVETPGAIASAPNPPLDPSAISGIAPAHDVLDRPTYDHNLEVIDGWTGPVTEHIGYLKSLGLDYGWGPTSMIEWMLEHVHVYSGLPWWGTIILGSALVRLAIFPIMLKGSEAQARMAIIKPYVDPLQKDLVAAMKSGDSQAAQVARHQMEALRARAGLNTMDMFLPMGVNAVFGFCGFRLLNGMSALPVPGMLTGGTAWFVDLSLKDPYFAIPAILGVTMYLSIKLNADGMGGGGATEMPAMRTVMLYGMPALITVSMSFLSVGTCLWIGTSMVFGILTTRIFQIPAFRSWAQMTPLTPGAASVSAMSGIADRLKVAQETEQAKVIDVKKVQEGSRGAARYQAPRKAAKNSSVISNVAKGIREKSGVEGKDRGQMGATERYVAWGTERINDLGETYSAVSKMGKKLLGRK